MYEEAEERRILMAEVEAARRGAVIGQYPNPPMTEIMGPVRRSLLNDPANKPTVSPNKGKRAPNVEKDIGDMMVEDVNQKYYGGKSKDGLAAAGLTTTQESIPTDPEHPQQQYTSVPTTNMPSSEDDPHMHTEAYKMGVEARNADLRHPEQYHHRRVKTDAPTSTSSPTGSKGGSPTSSGKAAVKTKTSKPSSSRSPKPGRYDTEDDISPMAGAVKSPLKYESKRLQQNDTETESEVDWKEEYLQLYEQWTMEKDSVTKQFESMLSQKNAQIDEVEALNIGLQEQLTKAMESLEDAIQARD